MLWVLIQNVGAVFQVKYYVSLNRHKKLYNSIW